MDVDDKVEPRRSARLQQASADSDETNAKRKGRQSRLGNRQRVTKEDAIEWIKTTRDVMVSA